MCLERILTLSSLVAEAVLRSFTSRTLAPSVRHCRDVQGWAKERPLVGWLWGKQFTLLHLLLNFNSYRHNLESFSVNPHTGLGWNVVPRLRECLRQVEAEVVSNSNNKIHQTWESLFWPPLYSIAREIMWPFRMFAQKQLNKWVSEERHC